MLILPEQITKPNIKSYTLEELLSRFFASINVTEETKKAYKFSLDCFFDWLKNQNVITPTEEHIIRYINSDNFNINKIIKHWELKNNTNYSNTKVTSATQSLYIAAVRRFFRWLENKRIYPDITKGIEISKENAGYYIRKPFQAYEIRQILDMIPLSTLVGTRDYAIINLMACTGIREIEVQRINIEDIKNQSNDIQNNNGQILLCVQRKRKKRKEGFVVLTEKAYEPIRAYLSNRPSQLNFFDPLFITHGNNSCGNRMSIKSIQDMIYERIKKAGIKRPGICGHSLRHFFATQLVEKGVSIEKIQEAMGHSSPTITSIYTKGMNRLKEPVENKIEF